MEVNFDCIDFDYLIFILWADFRIKPYIKCSSTVVNTDHTGIDCSVLGIVLHVCWQRLVERFQPGDKWSSPGLFLFLQLLAL